MEIFHIATASDWAAARRSGSYTTSTLGRSLEEEGFLHAARADQVAGVFDRYYRDAGRSLVLLTIDTGRLTAPWREDPVGEETYPHILGPLNVDAVVRVQEVTRAGKATSFTQVFLGEMLVRAFLGLLVMGLIAAGVLIGERSTYPWAAALGALAGLVVGVALATVVLRRRG